MPVDLAANPDLERSNCFTTFETFRNISNRAGVTPAFLSQVSSQAERIPPRRAIWLSRLPFLAMTISSARSARRCRQHRRILEQRGARDVVLSTCENAFVSVSVHMGILLWVTSVDACTGGTT